MKFYKPKYPKILECYNTTRTEGYKLSIREIINSKIEENNFISKNTNLKIKEGKMKGNDFKGFSTWVIITNSIPKWAFVFLTALWTVGVAFIGAWIQKTLLPCQ